MNRASLPRERASTVPGERGRRRPRRGRKTTGAASAASSSHSGALVIFAVALLLLLSLTPHVTERLDPVTGDEPFYLMTGISIVEDRDLDEANNYQARDFDRFYPPRPLPEDWRGWPAFPDPLPPHPTLTDREGLYSKHGLGLAVLAAAPFSIGGRTAVVVLLNVIAALAAANAYLLARRYLSPVPAAVVALGLTLTLPVLPYGYLIFPEIPAALLCVYLARRVLDSPRGAVAWLATGAALGALPWLHSRFLPLTIVALLLIAVRHRLDRRSWADRLAITAPVLAFAAAYAGYLIWLYGRPLPPVEDHDGFHGLQGLTNAAFGLLLDAQWGLLIYAPIYLLALACWLWFARRHGSDAWPLLALAAPYLLVIAAYRVWWGEWGPPARYLVPVALISVAPLAAWLREARAAGWALAGALFVGSAVLTAVGMHDPQRLYHHPDGHSKIYGEIGAWLGLDLAARLVAFQPWAMAPLGERLIWAVAAVAALLVAALLVDRCARRPA